MIHTRKSSPHSKPIRRFLKSTLHSYHPPAIQEISQTTQPRFRSISIQFHKVYRCLYTCIYFPCSIQFYPHVYIFPKYMYIYIYTYIYTYMSKLNHPSSSSQFQAWCAPRRSCSWPSSPPAPRATRPTGTAAPRRSSTTRCPRTSGG